MHCSARRRLPSSRRSGGVVERRPNPTIVSYHVLFAIIHAVRPTRLSQQKKLLLGIAVNDSNLGTAAVTECLSSGKIIRVQRDPVEWIEWLLG